MNFDALMNMLVSALIGLVVTGVFALLIQRLRYVWEPFKVLSGTGLKHFLSMERFARLDIFEKAIRDGQAGDEVLVIGRTLRWLIEDQRHLLVIGLKHGMNFKILILNPQKIKNQTIGLAPLQLKDPSTIVDDLKISLSLFQGICEEAQLKKYVGSFEVRICDYMIFNSLTAITQQLKLPQKPLRRVILDFSFSTSRVDKYQQYYESDPNDDDHFVNKMYRFYLGFFNQSQIYLKYDELFFHDRASLLHKNIGMALEKITRRFDDGEEIRGNHTSHLLPLVPHLLTSIRDGYPVPPPISVQFELNNECNTHCHHCKRFTWPKEGILDTDEVKDVLDQLSDVGAKTITFSGGEPTMRPDLHEILRHAVERGMHVGVLTNGLDINSDTATALTHYADWVRISVDAASELTYRRVRGIPNGLAKVVESVKNMEMARRSTMHDCRIGICYTIQKANIAEAANMLDFVKNLGLGGQEKLLTFKFVHGNNGFLCTAQQIADFQAKMLDRVDLTLERWTNLPYLKKMLNEYLIDKDIWEGQPLFSYYQRSQIRCFTPYLFSMIDAYGDVYPCCFLYYDNESYESFRDRRRDYRMGQLKKEKFINIWRGEAYSHIRDDLKVIDVNQFHACRECTRHFLHNTFLSKVTELYDVCQDEYGADAGDILLHSLHRGMASEIWL